MRASGQNGIEILGLRAAERLQALGHTVSAICLLPVHDNYLCNKVAVKESSSSGAEIPHADRIAFSMKERCALLEQVHAAELHAGTHYCRRES